MLGFLFGKQSDAEKILFKQFGRGNKNLNRIIRSIPVLSRKIYETSRTIATRDIRSAVEEYGKKFGNRLLFQKITPERLKKLDLEVVSYFLYFVHKAINEISNNEELNRSLVHAFHLELKKFFFMPEQHFIRYSQLYYSKTDLEVIRKKFTANLANIITKKSDVALAATLMEICPMIEAMAETIIGVIMLGQTPDKEK